MKYRMNNKECDISRSEPVPYLFKPKPRGFIPPKMFFKTDTKLNMEKAKDEFPRPPPPVHLQQEKNKEGNPFVLMNRRVVDDGIFLCFLIICRY